MSVVLSGRFEQEGGPTRAPAARRFAGLPVSSRIYTAFILAVGFGVLVLRAPEVGPAALQPGLLIAATAAVAVRFGLDLPVVRPHTVVSLGGMFPFAGLLLLGADVASAIAVVVAVSASRRRSAFREPTHITAFNAAAMALTLQATGWVYAWCGGAPPGATPGPPAALAVAALVFLLTNVVLVGVRLASSTGRPVLAVVREELTWAAPQGLAGAAAATLLASTAAAADYRLAAAVAVPLYLAHRGARHHLARVHQAEARAGAVNDLHLDTIEALARAIEAKDQATTCHIRRMHVYSAGLARAAGLAPDEVQGVRTAALLHDIGKLAVPDHILAKPAALSAEELRKVRIHPQVGAEILAGVAFPYPVAAFVLSHHERWDGTGYPHGLRGEVIPVGARILAVVDCFDALVADGTDDRSLAHAVERLRAEAGSALDPVLVDRFIGMLPELQAELERRGNAAPLPSMVTSGTAAEGRAGDDLPIETRTAGHAYHDIARAHREVYALYEIAQTMGTSLGLADTMTLIASKLSPLIPFSSCALFLHNEENDSLSCRFSSGVDCDLLQQITLPNGQGAVGWVARNLRPLVNARPKADVEAAGLSAPTALHSALVCPLVFSDRLIGALALYHVAPAAFTDDHRRLLDRICEQAGGVVHNSVLYEQTKRDSLTDPLTGLPNTRFMFVHLARELARAKRLGAEVSLLVLDLDQFKEINDRYGHHVGDRALREVARVFRSETRPYDICVRYAGDEFVIVLSGCGPGEAEAKRQELQDAVERVEFEVRPAQPLRLGVSCGSASFPRDGETYEALLSTADRRMYENKAERRRAAAAAENVAPEGNRPSVFAKIDSQPATGRTH